MFKHAKRFLYLKSGTLNQVQEETKMTFFIHNFGKNLARLRKEKGITQEELAKNIGLQKAAISKMELGTSYPTFSNLDKIAEFFNATPNQLFGTQTQIELENSVYKTDEYVEKAQDILAAGKLIYEIKNGEENLKILNKLFAIANTDMKKLLNDVEYES